MKGENGGWGGGMGMTVRELEVSKSGNRVITEWWEVTTCIELSIAG